MSPRTGRPKTDNPMNDRIYVRVTKAEKDEIRNKFGYLRKKLYQYVESNEFLKGKWAWNKISRQRHNL